MLWTILGKTFTGNTFFETQANCIGRMSTVKGRNLCVEFFNCIGRMSTVKGRNWCVELFNCIGRMSTVKGRNWCVDYWKNEYCKREKLMCGVFYCNFRLIEKVLNSYSLTFSPKKKEELTAGSVCRWKGDRIWAGRIATRATLDWTGWNPTSFHWSLRV